jgi:hypothetical protein
LKKLFREVARQLHPDIALDAPDRGLRTRLMAEAILAYRRCDAEALRRILEGRDSGSQRPQPARGNGD